MRILWLSYGRVVGDQSLLVPQWLPAPAALIVPSGQHTLSAALWAERTDTFAFLPGDGFRQLLVMSYLWVFVASPTGIFAVRLDVLFSESHV